MPTIAEKRSFVESLPDPLRDLLIVFYFHFLDRFIADHHPATH
jgi:hypothetical protein